MEVNVNKVDFGILGWNVLKKRIESCVCDCNAGVKGAQPILRTCPSALTFFLGKRRRSAAEAEPTVELCSTMSFWGREYLPLASGNSDFSAYASIFLRKTVGNARRRVVPEESRADRVVPRSARCWRSGLYSTDPTKSIWIWKITV